jgi:hypothetical protein
MDVVDDYCLTVTGWLADVVSHLQSCINLDEGHRWGIMRLKTDRIGRTRL